MKTFHRTRIAIAASAALGLAAMSSSASAQNGDPEYCSQVAWNICSWQGGHPTMPTVECLDEQYAACMNGYAALNLAPDKGDRRREIQAA
jgi:hypothetical protein